MGSVDRYWAAIGPKVVVKKQANIVAVAMEAKGWALKGYQPVVKKAEGAYPTGVVRFRQKDPGVVEASWENHPFRIDPTVPQWAVTVLTVIND